MKHGYSEYGIVRKNSLLAEGIHAKHLRMDRGEVY